MAGIQALANQHAGSRAGFLNPYLYRLARTGAATFQDVLPNALDRGNVRVDYANGVNPKDGLLYSVRTFDDDSSLRTRPGWDEVTGIGTPNTGYITNR
jgi:hypothetical protein